MLGALTDREESQICHSADPVQTVCKWILYEATRLQINQTSLVPPPILARVYQELSNGMIGYFMALKIADVPFPFPFAQFLQWALYAFFIFCPLVLLEGVEEDSPRLGMHWD